MPFDTLQDQNIILSRRLLAAADVLDVREASILVQQDCASSIVCHVEAIRQELVLEVFNCFLQGDDVPLPRNMFFDSSFSSTSRPWVPIVAAEPFLFGQSVGHVAINVILLARWRMFPGWRLAERRIGTLRIDNVTPKSDLGVRLHRCRKPSRMDETSSS